MLEEEFGIKELDDWYKVSYEQIKNIGKNVSQLQKVKLSNVLQQVYPQHFWDVEKLTLSGAKTATQNRAKALLHVYEFVSATTSSSYSLTVLNKN